MDLVGVPLPARRQHRLEDRLRLQRLHPPRVRDAASAWCCRAGPTSRRRAGPRRGRRDELQPGDLVFFNTLQRTFSHVGIYIGDDRFIHAPRTGEQVRIEDMSFAYWAKRFTGARAPDAPRSRPAPRRPGKPLARMRRCPTPPGRRRRPDARHNRRMAERVIPLADHRYRAALPRIPSTPAAPTGLLVDALGSGRCATCASRSPTAAISAAATACRRRCSTSTTPSCRSVAAELRGDHAAGRVCSSRTACSKIRLTGGEPLLRTRPGAAGRDAGRAAHRRRRAARPDAHHQRLAPGAQGRGAEGAPGSSRVTVSLDALDDAIFRRMNDADFPVAEVLAGIDAARARRARPDQGQHGRQARHQRRRRSCRWRATSAAATWRCASSSTWTSAPPTAGAWTRCCRRPRWSRASATRFPLERCRPRAPARRPSAGAMPSRRRRRDRHDLQRHPGVLPRLQPGPALDRGQALPLPVRQPRPRPARTAARRRERRRDRCRDRPASGRAATTATPSCAAAPAAADAGERRVEMHYIGG